MQRYENHWHELVKEDTGRFVLYSEAMKEIEKATERLTALAYERLEIIHEQEREIDKLKGEAGAWEKSFNIEWERLERLDALAFERLQIIAEQAQQIATLAALIPENENVKHHITEWENRCLKAEMIPVNTKTVGKP